MRCIFVNWVYPCTYSYVHLFIEQNSLKFSDKRSTKGRSFTRASSNNIHCIAWSSQVDAWSLNYSGWFFFTQLLVQFRSWSYSNLFFICLTSNSFVFCTCGTIPAFICILSFRFCVIFCFFVLITMRYYTKKIFFVDIHQYLVSKKYIITSFILKCT